MTAIPFRSTLFLPKQFCIVLSSFNLKHLLQIFQLYLKTPLSRPDFLSVSKISPDALFFWTFSQITAMLLCLALGLEEHWTSPPVETTVDDFNRVKYQPKPCLSWPLTLSEPNERLKRRWSFCETITWTSEEDGEEVSSLVRTNCCFFSESFSDFVFWRSLIHSSTFGSTDASRVLFIARLHERQPFMSVSKDFTTHWSKCSSKTIKSIRFLWKSTLRFVGSRSGGPHYSDAVARQTLECRRSVHGRADFISATFYLNRKWNKVRQVQVKCLFCFQDTKWVFVVKYLNQQILSFIFKYLHVLMFAD